MARGGSGGGSKGGARTVPYGGGNIAGNRFGGFGQEQPQPTPPTSIVAGGPNPYGAGNSLGASASRIIGDMRYNHNVGGYQGLPQQRAFQQPQPQPFRPQFQPFQPQPYRPSPMPFRAPSPGKGGSKGGGMNVPPMQNQGPMPMMQNPLGNRGSGMFQAQPMPLPYQNQNMGGYSDRRARIEARPAISRFPQQQMQYGFDGRPRGMGFTDPNVRTFMPQQRTSLVPQQATLQGLGGFFR